MRSWLLLLAVALAIGFAAFAAGCGGNEEEPAPPAAMEEPRLSTVKAGRLTVGSDIPFPPFEFREGGRLTGFDVELVEELAGRLELEVEWVDTSFETIFTQLAAGRFDIVASATTITAERERQVDFTEPYYSAQQALTVNVKETPDIEAVTDLGRDVVVAVQRGTTGETWARENVPEGVKVRSFPDAPDTYTALEAGNVTAVLFDEPSAIAEARKRPALKVVATFDTGERYGFAIDPRNTGLLAAVNKALKGSSRTAAISGSTTGMRTCRPAGTS
jgi:polar amino acid transport system substrate-binding protein